MHRQCQDLHISTDNNGEVDMVATSNDMLAVPSPDIIAKTCSSDTMMMQSHMHVSVGQTIGDAHVMQDELIERLGGVDAVAEMSGRKRRMVKQPNGTYKYCLRSSGDIALEKVCSCTRPYTALALTTTSITARTNCFCSVMLSWSHLLCSGQALFGALLGFARRNDAVATAVRAMMTPFI